tara:strand:- start:556 stop:1188 length:633 start_codon:yes stop_codon:yes gene_type:complete
MRYDGFFDLDHMRSYLKRSIIRVDDVPAYVLELTQAKNRVGKPIYKIVYCRLGGDAVKELRVNIKSKRVSLLPVPLGFSNYTNWMTPLCVIASRIPSRMWKIGLSQQNLLLKPVAGMKKIPISNTDFIMSESLSKTILGDFPSYYDSREVVKEHGPFHTVAFHRHFAIQFRPRKLALLYYKYNVPVGYATTGGARLKPQYEFLQEHLNEV